MDITIIIVICFTIVISLSVICFTYYKSFILDSIVNRDWDKLINAKRDLEKQVYDYQRMLDKKNK